MTRYARHDGYVGIGLQAVKGTGVAPSHFVKWSGAPTQTPAIEFTRHNEGGDSQYPGITTKQLHRPDGSFELFARPTITGLIFGLLLGKQVTTGSVQASPGNSTLSQPMVAGGKYAVVVAATNFSVADYVQIGGAGDEEVRPISAVRTAAATGSTTLTGDHAAGATALTVASSTNFMVDDYLTIGAGATIEVHKVSAVPDGTHITLAEGLHYAQGNGATITEITNVLELVTGVNRAKAAADAAVEKIAPFTHVFTPCAPASMPWATVERCLNDVLVNRFTDVRISQVEITGQKGEPIKLALSYLSIDETRQASAQSDTYETDDPFMFWQGAYVVDGVTETAEITSFRILVKNIFDENDQTSDVKRADIPLIRRDVEVSATLKFDSIEHYAKVFHGAAAGTTVPDDMYESAGAFSIDINYGTGSGAREFKIEVHNTYLTSAKAELDAASTESQEIVVEGHARKVAGAELVTVTVKSAEATKYCDA